MPGMSGLELLARTRKVGTSVEEVERRLILATLEHFEGNKKKAAEVLKIGLKTLYNRINQYKGRAPGARGLSFLPRPLSF